MEDNKAYFEDEVFKTKDMKKTVKRFIGSMGKQKARLIIVMLSVVSYTFFTIIAPLYSARVVDLIWNTIKENAGSAAVFRITWHNAGRRIFMLLLLYLAAAGFYTLQNFLMSSFAERLNLQLRNEISEKLQRLPLSFYDRRQPGEIMSRATNDLDKMSEALQTGLIRLFVAVGTIIGSVIMMLSFSVLLTLIFLVFMAFSLTLTNIVSRKTLKYAAERQRYVGKMNGLIEESYSGRMIIKAFNYEKQSSQRIHSAAEELARASEKTDFLMNAVNPSIRFVNRCGMVIIVAIGGLMLLDGRLSPGKLQAFFQYVNQAGEPITEMSFMINTMQSALASVERVYEFLDEEEISADSEGLRDINAQGNVRFNNVKFGYFPDKILMKDISFEARRGQKIAIVGSTGAGKTTLVNLLMRFYEVNGGSIMLDGTDTKKISRAALRSNFGMVLQDTWLFEGTIAENIAYGKPDATREEIVRAAKAARADFFIRTLPHGYDTLLCNDAENISVGQRQLLTIARVMLCNPAMLILDEATSSVDTRTEMEIGRAMNALMQNRTSFVIAHRLSTIVDADLILVMKNGDVIEQGTHSELLKANGAYAELYNSQFA